jgi:hypothetical protein
MPQGCGPFRKSLNSTLTERDMRNMVWTAALMAGGPKTHVHSGKQARIWNQKNQHGRR